MSAVQLLSEKVTTERSLLGANISSLRKDLKLTKQHKSQVKSVKSQAHYEFSGIAG